MIAVQNNSSSIPLIALSKLTFFFFIIFMAFMDVIETRLSFLINNISFT